MVDTSFPDRVKRFGKTDYAAYVAVVALSTILFIWISGFRASNLGVPRLYGSDGMFHLAVTKGIIDNGWVFDNSYLGMPYGQHELAFDHPEFLASSLQLAFLKLLSVFSSSAVVVVNMYYCLTFPMASLAALIAFRQFGLSLPVSFAASILFAFVPYHWLRSVGHLHLNAIYVIPLMTMVAVWIYREEIALVEQGADRRLHFSFKCGKAGAAGIICAATGATQGYFAFFGCFFLLVSGVCAATERRTIKPLLTALALVAIVSAVLMAALSPRFICNYRHGANPEVAERHPAEVEICGLRITQMLLPIPGHRIKRLASVTAQYQMPPRPVVNENFMAALGLVGGIGFLILLWRILFRRKSYPAGRTNGFAKVLDILGVMNMAGLLYATIGGFAGLFALTISPQLRAMNRISIYLAFFAFGAIAGVLDLTRQRLGSGRRSKAAFGIILCGVVAFGLFDQTPAVIFKSVPPGSKQHQFESDRDFVKQIESSLPKNSMVFQLPFVRFPESGTINRMPDYSHFRGYLHSKHLRWSYGAVKSRPSDNWQRRKINGQPLSNILESLVAANFIGIYIDRWGYADDGRAMESNLTRILGAAPIVSDDGRSSFYRLAGYAAKLESQYGPLKWAEIKESVFCTITLGERVTFSKEGTGVSLLGPGCSHPEEWGCWTNGKEATLNVTLPSVNSDLELVIEAKPYGPQEGRSAEVFFNGDKIALWDVGGKSATRFTALIKKSSVRAGHPSVIKLRFNKTFCPIARGTSLDSRELGLALEAMTLSEVPTGPNGRLTVLRPSSSPLQ